MIRISHRSFSPEVSVGRDVSCALSILSVCLLAENRVVPRNFYSFVPFWEEAFFMYQEVVAKPQKK
ncbi:hypothetical protein DXA57_06470 [Blautia sp. OF03-15BH]|nr:hypothetical protein DXA57_06470 [Blautia sp. OF03-15BH]